MQTDDFVGFMCQNGGEPVSGRPMSRYVLTPPLRRGFVVHGGPMMPPTPAKHVMLTRLEARVLRMSDLLKRARVDGDPLFIDMAERDLNALLDQLPRTKQPEQPLENA